MRKYAAHKNVDSLTAVFGQNVHQKRYEIPIEVEVEILCSSMVAKV